MLVLPASSPAMYERCRLLLRGAHADSAGHLDSAGHTITVCSARCSADGFNVVMGGGAVIRSGWSTFYGLLYFVFFVVLNGGRGIEWSARCSCSSHVYWHVACVLNFLWCFLSHVFGALYMHAYTCMLVNVRGSKREFPLSARSHAMVESVRSLVGGGEGESRNARDFLSGVEGRAVPARSLVGAGAQRRGDVEVEQKDKLESESVFFAGE